MRPINQRNAAQFLSSVWLFLGSLPRALSAPVLVHGASDDCPLSSWELQPKSIPENQYEVDFYFNDRSPSLFVSTLPGTRQGDKKSCTLEILLDLDPGYRFESLTYVVDGIYQVSERGTARLTISQSQGFRGQSSHHPPMRTTGFYSLSSGSPPAGPLLKDGFASSLIGNGLDQAAQECGAQIPISNSIFATVMQPTTDRSRPTLIELSGVHRVIIKLKPCEPAFAP